MEKKWKKSLRSHENHWKDIANESSEEEFLSFQQIPKGRKVLPTRQER